MLITFEGGEGSGKGTMVKKLAKYLRNKGKKVAVAREPGSVEISEEIRKVIQRPREGNLIPETELLLFEAARAQFVEEWLKPTLEGNDVVLLDRFYDSTTAYQGYGRGLDLGLTREMNRFASQGIVPDLTIILDVPPEIGLKRVQKVEFGSDGDRLEQEKMDFHEKVREGYLKMTDEERFVVIDAEQSVDEVFKDVLEAVDGL